MCISKRIKRMMNFMTSTTSNRNSEIINHYGLLVSNHVKLILESGLLLDEDYEVLLKAVDFKIYPIKQSRVSLVLIGKLLTAVGSIFLAKRYDTKLVLVPPIAIGLTSAWSKWRSTSRNKRRQEVVKELLKGLAQLRKLHSGIIRYMRTRNELNKKKQEERLLIYDKNVDEFSKILITTNQSFFLDILNDLHYLSLVDEELTKDFEFLRDMNVDELIQIEQDHNYQTLAKKVYDLHTFLSSKYLNYLGIYLSQHLKSKNVKEIDIFLDHKLPEFISKVERLDEFLRNQFNNLRYTASKKTEIEAKSRGQIRRHIEGKLHQTLNETVNNLSIIMERLQAVLEKVETEENQSKMETILRDLRSHSLATYESLDILCRLYGILSNSNKNEKLPESRPLSQRTTETKTNLEVVRFDDEIEPLEENYELFISKEEQVLPNQQHTDEDETGGLVYLGLMLKELRQSLTQHERFIAARAKRGFKDDEELEERKVKEISPPKFNLKVFDSKKLEKPQDDPLLEPIVFPLPPPPPPPPALPSLPSAFAKVHTETPLPPPLPPSFNLKNVVNDDDDVGSNRTLFDNIKALSSQIQGNEEIFGDGEDSDDRD